ncbi:MAG: protein kinase, partial [Lachnospiraceae bacterium]|nr:protein kinase [Lachnospiraceae bacterium]
MKPGFKIITTLSEHARSSVYIALDSSDHPVILKKILDPTALQPIKRIRNIDSPYLPKITEIYEEDGIPYVIEEFIEGKELSLLLNETTFSEEEACSLMKQLIEALRALHNLNPPLIHRDIKPENIIITPDFRLKLLDFDAVREWHDEPGLSDTRLLGTVGYAAPEQFGYSQTDCRTDLYSTGIVCSQICEKSALSAGIRKRLKAFTDKATMFDPKERFQSAGEMLTALKTAIHADAGDTNEPADANCNTTQQPGVSTGVTAKKMFVLTAVAAICLILGFAAYMLFPGHRTSYYNLEVLPDNYVYRSIWPRLQNDDPGLPCSTDAHYPGLISDNDDLLDAPYIIFCKESPRAFLFYDYRLESITPEIYLDRYASDNETIEDRLRIGASGDMITQGGIICLSVELLSRLKNGTYRLRIDSGRNAEWEYRLVITEKADTESAYP